MQSLRYFGIVASFASLLIFVGEANAFRLRRRNNYVAPSATYQTPTGQINVGMPAAGKVEGIVTGLVIQHPITIPGEENNHLRVLVYLRDTEYGDVRLALPFPDDPQVLLYTPTQAQFDEFLDFLAKSERTLTGRVEIVYQGGTAIVQGQGFSLVQITKVAPIP